MDKLSIYVNSKSTLVRRQAAIGEKRASKAFFIVTACRTDDDAVIRISIFEEKVMALGMVLDPTATRTDDIASPGPDAGMLIGKRVGFRLDRMWRAWDWISELWAQRFQEAGAEVSFWRSGGRSGDEGERMEQSYKEFLATIDVAVVGLANCGSCTGWTVRDAITAANAGLPTTAIATKNFEAFAHEIAARGGRSGLRVHVLPYPLNEKLRDEVVSIGEVHFESVLRTMGAQLRVQQGCAA